MAKKKNPPYLGQFDLGHAFQHLIDAAVRNQWTQSVFEDRLVSSKAFQRQFPGLVMPNGRLNPLLNTGSLSSTVNNYMKLSAQYQEIARNYPGVKVDRQTAGLLLAHDVSPQEFAARAQAEQTLKANPGLMAAFNEQLKAAGKPPLDELGMRQFFAGGAPADIYDTYEAAQLRTAGLDLTAKQAQTVAGKLGTPGTVANIGDIIGQVKATLGDVGPEIAKAGINLDELIPVLANQGLDAGGIKANIQHIIDQRRAQGTYVAGMQTQKGAGGGVALYQDTGAVSN